MVIKKYPFQFSKLVLPIDYIFSLKGLLGILKLSAYWDFWLNKKGKVIAGFTYPSSIRQIELYIFKT